MACIRCANGSISGWIAINCCPRALDFDGASISLAVVHPMRAGRHTMRIRAGNFMVASFAYRVVPVHFFLSTRENLAYLVKMTTAQRFAQILGIKMKEGGFSMADLEGESGISHQALYRYRSGAALPTLENFIKLAKVFGCYSLRDWGLIAEV